MNKNNAEAIANAVDPTAIIDLNASGSVKADADALEHCQNKILSAIGLPKEAFDLPSTHVEKIKAINPTIIVNKNNTTKPCYSILYYDITDATWHISYSSYELSYVRQWLAECFEPIEADVRPVTYGHWDDGICSNCGSEDHDCPKFCPSCGTEMTL